MIGLALRDDVYRIKNDLKWWWVNFFMRWTDCKMTLRMGWVDWSGEWRERSSEPLAELFTRLKPERNLLAKVRSRRFALDHVDCTVNLQCKFCTHAGWVVNADWIRQVKQRMSRIFRMACDFGLQRWIANSTGEMINRRLIDSRASLALWILRMFSNQMVEKSWFCNDYRAWEQNTHT